MPEQKYERKRCEQADLDDIDNKVEEYNSSIVPPEHGSTEETYYFKITGGNGMH